MFISNISCTAKKIFLQGSVPADGDEHRDEHGAHAGSAHACCQEDRQHCRQGDHNNLIKIRLCQETDIFLKAFKLTRSSRVGIDVLLNSV
jgi:hypothetical protein